MIAPDRVKAGHATGHPRTAVQSANEPLAQERAARG